MTSFRELYLRLDRRVLGVFRIALGAVLVYDVLRRFPDAGLLWSSDGVLSSEALRKVPQASPQLSFLLELSSASHVRLAFAALAVNWFGLGATERFDESRTYFFWVRLGSFILIIVAIWDKNRSRSSAG